MTTGRSGTAGPSRFVAFLGAVARPNPVLGDRAQKPGHSHGSAVSLRLCFPF